MHLDTLRQACANLARTTMWDLRPVDTERIQALADQFFSEAAKCMELIESPDDPAVVVRAVNFLRSTYAIPPMKDDTAWFKQALDLLLHLVYPNAAADEDGEAFLEDLEAGIVRARTLSGRA